MFWCILLIADVSNCSRTCSGSVCFVALLAQKRAIKDVNTPLIPFRKLHACKSSRSAHMELLSLTSLCHHPARSGSFSFFFLTFPKSQLSFLSFFCDFERSLSAPSCLLWSSPSRILLFFHAEPERAAGRRLLFDSAVLLNASLS